MGVEGRRYMGGGGLTRAAVHGGRGTWVKGARAEGGKGVEGRGLEGP
ncbi:hypothetical protein E2C01_084438 [Portunus trituberculatus]|uniref:Uncharacterized protein n=1 Tax=Portunus trituberculatus TaxID=210409 RepID=A0A5B7J7H6_PORTR|nr:hypothetical protein [Portunus trituberculatus]